mgnify:CR=1 FL=1
MGLVGNKIRDIIKNEINKNTEKIDHQVDCICKDIRKGKDQGKNIKKVTRFITDALKVIVTVTAIIKTVKAIQKTLRAARKAAEAGRKAGVVGASLNPAAAAIGIAQELIIKKVEEEEKDAKDALNIAPVVVEEFEDFCTRSQQRISQALIEKEMKDSIGN